MELVSRPWYAKFTLAVACSLMFKFKTSFYISGCLVIFSTELQLVLPLRCFKAQTIHLNISLNVSGFAKLYYSDF